MASRSLGRVGEKGFGTSTRIDNLCGSNGSGRVGTCALNLSLRIQRSPRNLSIRISLSLSLKTESEVTRRATRKHLARALSRQSIPMLSEGQEPTVNKKLH